MKQENTFLGIELGSTRIKAVLIGEDYMPIASGAHDWENKLVDGVWTYSLADVWQGMQHAYSALAAEVKETYGIPLTTVRAMGVSAMMHGYLPFDAKGNQLTEFRTWRNTSTGQASEILSETFGFNIPQRWSIAHLYQAVLNKESTVNDIAYLTTLAGYVHWQLTGEQVVGVGEASGMFPIENDTYNQTMVAQFDALTPETNWHLTDILPNVLTAGTPAGTLTEHGALLLDPTGALQAGIPLCPPEGDAGTGMVATNSVTKRTGNVSAGTSVFAMVVLENALSKMYPEIDMVTTPDGAPVAMVHCNNCTGDLDAWVKLMGETLEAFGVKQTKTQLYQTLYTQALSAQPNAGGMVSYNYYSGEPVTELVEGRPLFMRLPDAAFTLPNFMRNLLYSAMASLKLGMDILTKEQVQLDQLLGHGGLFKTKNVAQSLMASALNVPVTVMETAGEGGAWGIALLAAYLVHNQNPLPQFLALEVFAGATCQTTRPKQEDVQGFAQYMQQYAAGLPVQQAAVQNFKGGN